MREENNGCKKLSTIMKQGFYSKMQACVYDLRKLFLTKIIRQKNSRKFEGKKSRSFLLEGNPPNWRPLSVKVLERVRCVSRIFYLQISVDFFLRIFVDSRILSHSARFLLPSSIMQAWVFDLRKPFLTKIIIIQSVWSNQQRHLPFVAALHK